MKTTNIFLRIAEYAAKKNVIFIERVRNKVLLSTGKIGKTEYDLKKYYLKKIRPYSSVEFYQNYPPLRIRGRRPTFSRFLIYGLDKYLTKQKNVLDIGGNTGFFSLFIADKVKKVDVLEVEDVFAEICKELARRENTTNVSVITKDFKKFSPREKYDVILSFAVHNHTKMEFNEYIQKVFSHLKNDGVVLIESHPIRYGKDDVLYEQLRAISNVKILRKGEIDDDGRLRTFFYIKQK